MTKPLLACVSNVLNIRALINQQKFVIMVMETVNGKVGPLSIKTDGYTKSKHVLLALHIVTIGLGSLELIWRFAMHENHKYKSINEESTLNLKYNIIFIFQFYLNEIIHLRYP